MIIIDNIHKDFTLHNQGGTEINVLTGVSCSVPSGQGLVLHGESGKGKSTLLRMLYGNYTYQAGNIKMVVDGKVIDFAKTSLRQMVQLRRNTIGWVSQFLRLIPRVKTIDLVMAPLLDNGVSEDDARMRAEALLKRLNIPERLWELSPSTFSGGEQQRVNIACGFIMHYPILLLDEPTASLDATNKAVVVELIKEAKARGTTFVGIFHDADVRDAVADVVFEL